MGGDPLYHGKAIPFLSFSYLLYKQKYGQHNLQKIFVFRDGKIMYDRNL